MEKLFVSRRIALRLKHFRFNEPCFGYYSLNNEDDPIEISVYCNHNLEYQYISAPTHQQVTNWLREKFGLDVYVIAWGSLIMDNGLVQNKYEGCITSIGGITSRVDSISFPDYYKSLEETISKALILIN